MHTPNVPFPVQLINMITAKWTTMLISTAAELGVIDVLAHGPADTAELARQTRTHESMLYRFLRALGSIGIVHESDATRFELSDMGRLLVTGSVGSMRSLAMMVGSEWHDRCWEKLAESVRTGRSGADLAFGKDLWAYLDQDDNKNHLSIFNEAMTAATTVVYHGVVKSYDFSGIGTLVDIGGGHGRLLGSILAQYPKMNGIVFDRPHLAASAGSELQALAVDDRCRFVGGDFFVAVPEGGDAYLMKQVLHNWPDEKALSILRNCRKVMSPGMRLIVLDAVVPSQPGPHWGKLMDVEIFLLFGGQDRTKDEFDALFAEAGFSPSRIIPTGTQVSVVEVTAV